MAARVSVDPTPRRIAVGACLMLATALPGLAPSLAQAQQAPPESTQLGVMIVTPSRPSSPATHAHKTKINRKLLNFGLDNGTTPRPPQAQTKKPATPPAAKPPSTPAPHHEQAPAKGAGQKPLTAAKRAPVEPTRTPASALHIVSPKYPAKAFSRKVRGSVKVRFTIKPDGHTADIRIVSSTPSDIFDDATRQAVRQWRFRPATENGKPVATTLTQQLVFNPPMKRHEAAAPPPRPRETKKPPEKATPANRVPSNITPVHIVAPKYPPQAYRSGHGGSVTIQFMVGTDGRTHNIRILRAKPPRTFNLAAKRAVRQWRFKPVDKPTKVIQTINFTPP